MLKRRGTFFYARARTARSAAQMAPPSLLVPALALFSALILAAVPVAAQEAGPEAVQPAAAPSAEGAEVWVRQLRDKDAKVRQDARESLLKAGEASVRPLVASIGALPTRSLAWDMLAALGPKAVPGLIALLGDPEFRIRAGGALFATIDPRSSDQAPALLACARDPEVKFYCLQSLVKAMGPKGKDQVPLLIETLADRDADVRIHAAAAIGVVGPKAPGGVEALIKSLADEDPRVRAMSAQSLAKMGRKAKKAGAALQEAAEKDSDEGVRRAAAKALEAFRG